MADWTLPTVNDTYTNYLAYLKNRDLDLALMLDPAHVTLTNPQANMGRFNSANKRWELYSGTAWGELIPKATDSYDISVTYLGNSPAAAYAKLASPTFTGTPQTSAPANGDNTTRIATCAFVLAQNVASATKLATIRTINGVGFDGTAPISFGTDSVAEGATNLYFTTARARTAISVSGSLAYNSSTGVISYTQPANVSAFTNDAGYLTASSTNTLTNKTLTNSDQTAQTLAFANAGTTPWDASAGGIATVNIPDGQSTTLAVPTNLKKGTYILHLIKGALGTGTLAFAAGYKWSSGSAPVLSTSANAHDIITFVSDGSAVYGAFLPAFA